MSILKSQMAALRARLNAPAVAKPKPRVRVRDGKYVIRLYAVLAEPKPASNVHHLVKYARTPVKAGQRCTHCHDGSGAYVNPVTREKGKCYVCNGRGRINARDAHFDQERWSGKRGPLCNVASA